MKIYLAAQYARKDELRKYAKELRKLGHTCISRWLRERANPKMDLDPAVSYLRLAERDMDDIFNSHMFVIFTVDPHEFIKRGGKHFEAGYAYALGIRICVVGPNENIFYSLPEMQHFRDWNDFICREPEWAN